MCVCVFVCGGGERFTDKYTQPEKVTDRKGVGKTEREDRRGRQTEIRKNPCFMSGKEIAFNFVAKSMTN